MSCNFFKSVGWGKAAFGFANKISQTPVNQANAQKFAAAVNPSPVTNNPIAPTPNSSPATTSSVPVSPSPAANSPVAPTPNPIPSPTTNSPVAPTPNPSPATTGSVPISPSPATSSATANSIVNTPSGSSLSTDLNQLLISVIQLLIGQIQQMLDTPNTTNNTNTTTSPSPSASPVSPTPTATAGETPSLTPQQQTTLDGISQIVPFNTAVGATEPGPIRPGDSVEINFTAKPGQNISFASMYAPTNDYFFSAGESGIPVYDDFGKPITGDVSHLIGLWDAGTEADEVPFEGQYQTMDRTAQKVAEPNTGPDDPNSLIRRIDGAWGLPPVNELLKGELIHNGGESFTLRLTNVSGNTKDASPISPGMLAVHDNTVHPFFDNFSADRGWGLEGIAEDGDPTAMVAKYKALLAA